MPSTVSAILLAAAKSRHMGRSKPLLPLGNRPLVRHCLDALLDGGVEDILLVVGTCGDAVAETALGLPVTVVRNPDPEGELAGSLRCALRALPADRRGVIVAMVDNPLVSAGTIARLLKQQTLHPHKVLVPTCRGRRGHPILFPRLLLEGIAPPSTLREIVDIYSARVLRVPVDDPGSLLGLDTPAEYRRAVRLLRDAPATMPHRPGLS